MKQWVSDLYAISNHCYENIIPLNNKFYIIIKIFQ